MFRIIFAAALLCAPSLAYAETCIALRSGRRLRRPNDRPSQWFKPHGNPDGGGRPRPDAYGTSGSSVCGEWSAQGGEQPKGKKSARKYKVLK